MERRVLLAIFLSFLVLFLYQTFIVPVQPPTAPGNAGLGAPVAPSAPGTLAAPGNRTAPNAPGAPSAQTAPSAPSAPVAPDLVGETAAREIVIETDDVRA